MDCETQNRISVRMHFYGKTQYLKFGAKSTKTALTFAFEAFIISVGIPKNKEVTKLDSCDGSYRRRGCFEKNDSDENHIRTHLRHDMDA